MKDIRVDEAVSEFLSELLGAKVLAGCKACGQIATRIEPLYQPSGSAINEPRCDRHLTRYTTGIDLPYVAALRKLLAVFKIDNVGGIVLQDRAGDAPDPSGEAETDDWEIDNAVELARLTLRDCGIVGAGEKKLARAVLRLVGQSLP